jgi:hypothetical protein
MYIMTNAWINSDAAKNLRQQKTGEQQLLTGWRRVIKQEHAVMGGIPKVPASPGRYATHTSSA